MLSTLCAKWKNGHFLKKFITMWNLRIERRKGKAIMKVEKKNQGENDDTLRLFGSISCIRIIMHELVHSNWLYSNIKVIVY